MKRFKPAIITALLLAIVGCGLLYSPYGQRIEEEFGLALLFKLRGPRPPPGQAVIVNIDHESSKELGLEKHYSKWPRTVHAALVDKLVQYGANVIAFDMHFAEDKRQKDDLAFAEAIQRAGNVILVEKLEYRTLSPSIQQELTGNIEMEILVPPIQPLADAAMALAPFPLPKLPVRVDRAWLFKDTSGGIPTLPAIAFQAATLPDYERLHSLLTQHITIDSKSLPEKAQEAVSGPGLVETMRNMRMVFQENPNLYKQLIKKDILESSEDTQHLVTLIKMYGGESIISIDFHGPPASHKTLTYHDILASDQNSPMDIANIIKGKVVFIGAARRTWSNQKDGFYTVFSQKDGLDLSGVELAATIFTNLAENRTVQKLSVYSSISLVVLIAIAACLLSFLLQPAIAIPLLLGSMGISLFSAHTIFSAGSVWMPLVIPVMLLPVTAFLIATLSAYLTEQRERRHISKALGYYLPTNVVEELSKDLSFIKKGDRMVYSACLMTDAKNYTTLSESLPPEEMSILIKEYYQYLFREVKNQDGLVCNVIGDSMLAIWPASQPLASLREKACKAALQIAEAVEEFNKKHPETPLPTRIGLHSGHLLMGNIGAEDHFEYAPVGDIVNTASRIEGLNKHLGTQILASKEALDGVTDIPTRELGLFLLSGKSQLVYVLELFSNNNTDIKERKYVELFSAALKHFRQREWIQALELFEKCLRLKKTDGPTLFYKKICESFMEKSPPESWQGEIKMLK